MKFPEPQDIQLIAALIGAELKGKTDLQLTGTNEIHRIEEGEIVFVDHPKYYDKALYSKASAIIINNEVEVPEGKAVLIVKEPFTAFNQINRHFLPEKSIHRAVSDTAEIGEETIIQAGCVIGNHVKIGKHCTIHPNVTILDRTEIGDYVTIHSGTVLGADAFYFKNRGNSFEKLQSVGKVVIEDHVEIGANCTIDRGVTAITRIGTHTKMDNLIQVGHDTEIGNNCLIASQVGIAGCCSIGNRVKLWGQVGIKADIIIEDDVEVYAQSGVKNNLKAGNKYFGSPAEEAKKMFATLMKIKRL